MAKKLRFRLDELLTERRPHQTKRSFAIECGIRPNTIIDICENKAPAPKLANLERICEVLQCEIGELLVMVEEDEKS